MPRHGQTRRAAGVGQKLVSSARRDADEHAGSRTCARAAQRLAPALYPPSRHEPRAGLSSQACGDEDAWLFKECPFSRNGLFMAYQRRASGGLPLHACLPRRSSTSRPSSAPCCSPLGRLRRGSWSLRGLGRG